MEFLAHIRSSFSPKIEGKSAAGHEPNESKQRQQARRNSVKLKIALWAVSRKMLKTKA